MSDVIQRRATIERKNAKMPRFIVIPAIALTVWRLTKTTVVEATLNDIDIGRRSLKRWDDNRWFIDLTEQQCRQAKVDTGDRVELTIQIASEELPQELTRLIETDAAARATWDSLTSSQQRMLREHVAAAKLPTTRERRAACALLK